MDNQTKTLTPVVTPTAIQAAESLQAFKQGVDNLLAKRSYFISQVLPKLKENQDYYVIMGKKSLSKGGSEKLVSIYNLTAMFERDDKTMEMLSGIKGLVAYVCNLTRNGVISGQGRGADTLARHSGDPNKTIKMAQKRAFIDAVIRTTGLSDIFTQDLETMSPAAVGGNSYKPAEQENQSEEIDKNYIDSIFENADEEPVSPAREDKQYSANMITPKQRSLLVGLIHQKIFDQAEQDKRLAMVDGLTKFEASDVIGELLEQQ